MSTQRHWKNSGEKLKSARLRRMHMIDLINKNINPHLLLQKFMPVLESLIQKETHLQLSYIFNVAVEYIKKNYPDIEQDWKAWCTVAIKDIFLKDSLKINNEKDIENIIDAFMLYYNEKYSDYLNNVASYVTEYFRDYPFVSTFVNKELFVL